MNERMNKWVNKWRNGWINGINWNSFTHSLIHSFISFIQMHFISFQFIPFVHSFISCCPFVSIHFNHLIHSFILSFLSSFPSFIHFISFHFISFPLISFQFTSFQITNNSCKQTCSYNYVQFLKLLPGRVPGTTWYIYIILLILT